MVRLELPPETPPPPTPINKRGEKYGLAAEPAARPANGAAVAQEVANLRFAADQRARHAEIEKHKAEVQARADRKRRRVQILLGGAIVAALLIGGSISTIKWLEADYLASALKESVRTADEKTAKAIEAEQKAVDEKNRSDEQVKRAIAANLKLFCSNTSIEHFNTTFPNIQVYGESAVPALSELVESSFFSKSKAENKDSVAQQQANAAVALVRLGQPEKVWPLLKHSSDPQVRSYLIHRFALFGASPKILIAQLAIEPDTSIRRALILGIGEFDEKQLSKVDREVFIEKLKAIYSIDPDAGMHAAAEYVLQKWKQNDWLQQTLNERVIHPLQGARDTRSGVAASNSHVLQERAITRSDNPAWSINSMGQTMIHLQGPVEFLMGSPESEAGRHENEKQHMRRIPRSFAIAATSVTRDQYEYFLYNSKIKKPSWWNEKADDRPMGGISWHAAAAYCNWLSSREGLLSSEHCYVIDDKWIVIKMKPNYLSLKGYRLPTEAEWEYAARAGANASYCFGESKELLAKYRMKPNDFGFFDDKHLLNWCKNVYSDYKADNGVVLDVEENLSFDRAEKRVLRGTRSAYRSYDNPDYSYPYFGLRPVRTIAP